MRVTEFWRRLRAALGTRADVIAQDTVLTSLGSRTVVEALRDGVAAKEVWAAVCRDLELPEHVR